MTYEHQDVGLFHERFGLDNTHWPRTIGPRDLPDGLLDFRLKFMQEELAEFIKGMEEDDIGQMADALVDLAYVIHGTAHLLGLPWDTLWNDVQRANMSKVRANPDGSNSKRGSSFDVVKPAGWVGPHTNLILRNYGFETKD